MNPGGGGMTALIYASHCTSQHCVAMWKLHACCLMPAKDERLSTLDSDMTALHLAAGSGCLETVWLLVENGANIDVPMIGGQTPWHFVPCGSVLNGSTALRLAFWCDHRDVVNLFGTFWCVPFLAIGGGKWKWKSFCRDRIFIDLPGNLCFWGGMGPHSSL